MSSSARSTTIADRSWPVAAGLTARRSSFTRRDVLQAWSERVPAAADVSVVDLERLADEFLASERAVVLAAATGDEPSGALFAPGRAGRADGSA